MNKVFLTFVFLLFIASTSVSATPKEIKSFFGEEVTYSIRQVGIQAGEATLRFTGTAEKGGKAYLLINFKASGLNFLDEERIFTSPDTLLPEIVERNVNIFGKKEKITEYYDTAKGEVRIVKVADGKTTEQVLKKQGPIDNIYCFIYRYRRDNDFVIGKNIALNLPTMDVKLRLRDEVKINIGDKKYNAVYIQSDPKKYKIWFDRDEHKIPLRIDGAVGFGNTSMTMKEYKGQNKK